MCGEEENEQSPKKSRASLTRGANNSTQSSSQESNNDFELVDKPGASN